MVVECECEHEVVLVLHRLTLPQDALGTERPHVLHGAGCWCRPQFDCALRGCAADLDGVRHGQELIHIHPMWSTTPENPDRFINEPMPAAPEMLQ